MKHVAIIGGGISGLSAAYELAKLRREGAEVSFELYESLPRLGGALRSERVEGCVVEAGPDSFISEKPWAAELCRELGLGGELVGSNDAKRKTYIRVRGRLVEMPDGLMFMVPTKLIPTAFTPLFSLKTKLRMAMEFLLPPRAATEDEPVSAMVARHFGAECVDRLADPLLSGVYGGDSARLSARAVLPGFVEMEKKYGSLCRAMLAARRRMRRLAAKSSAAKPALFTTLGRGMSSLGDAIVATLPPESVHTSARVTSVERSENRWKLTVDGGEGFFDAIIVATPAHAAAALLRGVNGELAADLDAIPYSSSVTMTLGYDAEQLRALPEGFGFLVPRSEGLRMLAGTFVHRKFDGRAPADMGLVRCFLGGIGDAAVLDLNDETLIALCRSELCSVTGLDAEPRFVRLYRWPRAMAQYAPGHLERVARIESAVQTLPGLALAGNAYHGIGVPDCTRGGRRAARSVVNVAQRRA